MNTKFEFVGEMVRAWDDKYSCWYTDENGNGLYHVNTKTGKCRQSVDTDKFSVAGMDKESNKKKILRYITPDL